MIQKHPTLFGIACGVAYGLVVQASARTGHLKDVVGVMSFGFVFLLPFALGFVTSYFAKGVGWRAYVLAPQATILACLGAAIVIGWEGLICLILATPVYCAMGALGGLLAYLTRRWRNPSAAFIVMLLPPTSAAVEHVFPPLPQLHQVHTQIAIAAKPEVVWSKIVAVEPITEPITGFFYHVGFPKPIEAVVSHPGVGGVRHARFEKDLVFIETVDAWDEGKRFSFRIDVDPNNTPLTTLDPHVTVGGDYFDVMRGTYWLEPKGSETILHLESEFRLSTAFNTYAGAWGDFLMRDIQNSILAVIAQRARTAAAQ